MIGELKAQINLHKSALDKRAASLMESHTSADKLLMNLDLSEKELAKSQLQSNQLDATLLKLMRSAKFSIEEPNAATAKVADADKGRFNKTVILPNAPFIGGNPQAVIS